MNFRDKTYGWHNIALKVDSEKGLSLEKRSKSSFFLAFDDGYFYNEQCYRCELNNGNGVSDIRIGDCWGEAFKNNQTGVSRVLIGTEKGRAFFESIRPSMHCADLEMHLPANNKRNFAAFKALRNTAIEKAQTAPDLKRVIKFYRSKLPLKTRVFCYLRNNKVFKALYALKSTSK